MNQLVESLKKQSNGNSSLKRKTSSSSSSVDESSVRTIFNAMSPDENGKVSFEDFFKWYKTMKAQEQLGNNNGIATKKAKTLASSSTSSSSAAVAVAVAKSSSTSSSSGAVAAPLSKSRQNSLLKSIVNGMKTNLKKQKFFLDSIDYADYYCTGESVMTVDEFNHFFTSIGEDKVQFDKDGKEKKSRAVITKELTRVETHTLFPENSFTKIEVPLFHNSRAMFAKTKRYGKAKANVKHCLVTYSKNTNVCKIKFTVNLTNLGGNERVFYDDDKVIFGRFW